MSLILPIKNLKKMDRAFDDLFDQGHLACRAHQCVRPYGFIEIHHLLFGQSHNMTAKESSDPAVMSKIYGTGPVSGSELQLVMLPIALSHQTFQFFFLE